jgi:nicotinate-nucleotide adenylyltransferase
MKIGVLGGTFDPIHLGHLLIAEEAGTQLALDRVIFMPAGQPWLKDGKPLSDALHRVEMVRLAVADNPYFEVSLQEVDRPGPSYTVDTLEKLTGGLGAGNSIHFILGVDALHDFHRWKDPERILELSGLVVAPRPGHPGVNLTAFLAQFPNAKGRVQTLQGPSISISGTEIRGRAKAGQPLGYLVPQPVADYIERHRLYVGMGANPESGLGTSTVKYMRQMVETLFQVALEKRALQYGDFTLTSGKTSPYYFDGRLLSLDPEGAYLIGEALLPLFNESGVEAIGGLTLGADPIVTAVSLAGYRRGDRMPAFIVRKEVKAHGTMRGIEGPLPAGAKVAIVDDVCTTGGSLFQAIEAAEAADCQVVKVAVVLDRAGGGSEEIRSRGYDFQALLTASQDGTVRVADGI